MVCRLGASLSGRLQRVVELGSGKLSTMESGASRKMGILVRVPQGPLDISRAVDEVTLTSLDDV